MTHPFRDHRKLGTRRICGVCKFFDGPTISGAGECTKHHMAVLGGNRPPVDCDDWTRRMAGVDPIPFISGVAAPKVEAPAPAVRHAAPRPMPPEEIETRRHAGQAAARAAKAAEVKPAPPRAKPVAKPSRSRCAEVEALARTGMPQADICRQLGLSPAAVSRHVKAIGIPLPRGKGGDGCGPARMAAMHARRDHVRAMVADGASGQEIAERLNVSADTIYADCKALGLTLTRGGAGRNDPAMPARREACATEDARA